MLGFRLVGLHSRRWNPRENPLQVARATSDIPAAGRVVEPLVRWYARARRDLPWRGSRDPYCVWVSEIMLQQTQVERVRDYFTRFTARFPTVEALARAREAEVLQAWEGLGDYRRARQLHAAARVIVADHGGRFPRTVVELRRLPGIGRYTAGAIASIAFDVSAPIVEANSRRVFARLVGHDRPLGGAAGDGPIWEVAEQLVPRRHPGRFNQAVMDLGAMVCTPDRPLCTRCPLASMCLAHREGRTATIPVKTPRRAAMLVCETAVIIRRGGRLLVEQRGPGEWWEGLWDFPRLAQAGRPRGRTLGVFSYTVTHHKITCTVVEQTVTAGAAPASNRGRWVRPGDLASLALSSPGRRIAKLVVSSGNL
jgi:A/G-specific adenine glycosylase